MTALEICNVMLIIRLLVTFGTIIYLFRTWQKVKFVGLLVMIVYVALGLGLRVWSLINVPGDLQIFYDFILTVSTLLLLLFAYMLANTVRDFAP